MKEAEGKGKWKKRGIEQYDTQKNIRMRKKSDKHRVNKEKHVEDTQKEKQKLKMEGERKIWKKGERKKRGKRKGRRKEAGIGKSKKVE